MQSVHSCISCLGPRHQHPAQCVIRVNLLTDGDDNSTKTVFPLLYTALNNVMLTVAA